MGEASPSPPVEPTPNNTSSGKDSGVPEVQIFETRARHYCYWGVVHDSLAPQEQIGCLWGKTYHERRIGHAFSLLGGLFSGELNKFQPK